jgi:plasmid maintenance system antidote protein VapI
MSCNCHTGWLTALRGYKQGDCRCPIAREAYRIYRKRLRERRHEPLLVDAAGTVRRMRALAAIGWSPTALAPHLNTTPVRVQGIRGGYRPTVTRETADRVAAVYNQLSGTPGPSASTRGWATRYGWPPPLLWDGLDIDDPDTQPHPDTPTADRGPLVHLDEVEHLERFGLSLHEIARQLGVQPSSVVRAQHRRRRHNPQGDTMTATDTASTQEVAA